MSKPRITLYVDIVSPFAYMAFYALHNFPIFAQCEITYIPIFLGGLLRSCGNIPPMKVKNKATYTNHDRLRLSTHLKIPISPSPPQNFPTNTILPQRVLTSLSLSHSDLLPAALAVLYQNYWVEYTEPENPENLVNLLTTVLGSASEAQKVVNQAQGKEIRDLLVQRTESAMAEGAFGLPWFVATNSKGDVERFWGVDRLGMLGEFLGLERGGVRGFRALL